MILIGENIHIISKKTKQAIQDRDVSFIQDLAKRQKAAGVHYIDLNIGPAKRQEGVMEWLINTVTDVARCGLCLDTTNQTEMEAGLKLCQGKIKTIINSTSGDPQRLETMMPLAAQYKSDIIGLTMNDQSGIPKDPDGRVEIAFAIVEKATEEGVENENIWLDPLVLPVSVSQEQIIETLNSIRVFKESFDPPVKTLIGLSNVSNGSPKELRSLINRVFMVLAIGCGLDSAIVDAFDTELVRTAKLLVENKPEHSHDQVLIDLCEMMKSFGELGDVSFDKDDPEQVKIVKTAQILLNETIYAHNYLSL